MGVHVLELFVCPFAFYFSVLCFFFEKFKKTDHCIVPFFIFVLRASHTQLETQNRWKTASQKKPSCSLNSVWYVICCVSCVVHGEGGAEKEMKTERKGR